MRQQTIHKTQLTPMEVLYRGTTVVRHVTDTSGVEFPKHVQLDGRIFADVNYKWIKGLVR